MYRLTLRQCSQRKESDWGPNLSSAVQPKALSYPALWSRDSTTTTRKPQGGRWSPPAACSVPPRLWPVCFSLQAILTAEVSGFILGSGVVFSPLGFLLIISLIPLIPPSPWEVQAWAANLLNVLTAAAGSHCFYSHKTSVVFTKRSLFSM